VRGDKFLVLLTSATEKEAEIVRIRIAERVDDWNASGEVEGHSLGLSCGISTYTRSMKVDDIIESADKQMYERKAIMNASAVMSIALQPTSANP
jgi:PleD family two-component response regulator